MSLSKANLLFVTMSMLPLLALADDGPKLEKGRAVYKAVCMACHAQVEWARRPGQRPGGLEMLTTHAVDGFGAMPPKGGRPDLTRPQIRDAIEYMRRGKP